VGLSGSHVDSTAHEISPCGSPGSPVFFRDMTRTSPLPPFGALLHATPRDAPMPRHRLDVIRCASFRTLLLPAGVLTPAVTSSPSLYNLASLRVATHRSSTF
jgi:hypothetical protein